MYRFNRGRAKSRGKLFYTRAPQALQEDPVLFATRVYTKRAAIGGVCSVSLSPNEGVPS